MADSRNLKNYLRAFGFKPKDYLGQNFLLDEEILQKIVDSVDLTSDDTVLEVGPGLGILTGELVKKAGRVIAVEKDERLAGILANVAEDFSPPRNGSLKTSAISVLEIVSQDILKFHLDKHIQGPYKVVANIPYYLTSKLFRYFLEQKNQPQLLALMVQKEVGERVVAKPGKLSILGISVQAYADAELVQRTSPSPRQELGKKIGDLTKGFDKIPDQVQDGFGSEWAPLIVPKTSFWPVPEVDSVILKIIPREKYPEIKDKILFFSIIKRAFAGKRKQIKNTIKNEQALLNAGIDPTARPQDLSIDDWIRLYQAIDKFFLRT